MPIVNLTARYVETVKTGDGRLEIRDAKVKGLELRVRARGGKSWLLRYRRQSDGTKRVWTMGRFPEMTLEEARETAADARRAIAKGGDPATGKQVAREAPTFKQLAEQWQQDYAEANRSERVRADDASALNRHILPEIGDMKAHAVQRADIGRVLNLAKKAKDGRQGHDGERRLTHRPNKVHEVMRAVYRWGVSEGLVTVDPTQGRKRPIRKEAARERTLTPTEVKALWEALDKAPATRERLANGRIAKRQEGALPLLKATALVLKLSLTTGQRIGEVCGITLSELDRNDVAPVWKLGGDRTKNDEPQRVPLSKLALELIGEAEAIAGSSRWLFPNPTGDGPLDPHAVSTAARRARKDIGIDDWHPHDLRRSSATLMGEMGIAPHVISRIMNHVSVSRRTVTGKHYLQFDYEPEKRAALNAWGDRLERIIAGTENANVRQLQGTA
jgi:integrase